MDINFLNASNTLKKIINDKRGFRNNNFQNSKVTNLKDIVKYEYNELGNEDIIDTIYKLYDHKIDKTKNIINNILEFISKLLNEPIDNLKGVWVTTYEAVEKLYKLNSDDAISVFNFNDKKWMIISDLSEDGILIAYAK